MTPPDLLVYNEDTRCFDLPNGAKDDSRHDATRMYSRTFPDTLSLFWSCGYYRFLFMTT